MDDLGIYGSDENAMKAAAHDLKGLMRYSGTRRLSFNNNDAFSLSTHPHAAICDSYRQTLPACPFLSSSLSTTEASGIFYILIYNFNISICYMDHMLTCSCVDYIS
jgi:hypothetical protein